MLLQMHLLQWLLTGTPAEVVHVCARCCCGTLALEGWLQLALFASFTQHFA